MDRSRNPEAVWKSIDDLWNLFSRLSGGAGGGSAGARVVTPNAETVIAGPTFTPGVAGKIMAVVDITPTKSGLLSINATFAVLASSPDIIGIQVSYVDLLTSISGGALVAPGITGALDGHPDIVTVPAPAGGVFSTAAATFVSSGINTAIIPISGLAVQAVVGHRTGIVFTAVSSNNAFTWNVGGAISVIEQP